MAVTQDARTEGTVLERYAQMLLIRLFEGEIHRLFLRGEVHGTTHLYAGQEAVAVGVCATTPSIRLWQILTSRARSPSPT